MDTLSIANTTRSQVPCLPFQALAHDILGTKYELSLSFIGSARAQRLNHDYRGKDYVPNVLSFPLDDTHGEIFICPIVAKKEAVKFAMTPTDYIGFLFVHGCLHLKGHDHGDAMEKLEQKYCRKYF